MTKLEKKEMHQSMRGYFAGYLYNAMIDDPSIWLVTADLGYGMWDKIRDTFPNRFLNTGASEMGAVGICAGLALEDKKPFFYSITSFLLRRPYEAIRLYVDGEKIPVRLVGGGRDKDYHIDGPSHDASDAKQLLATLPNIRQLWPNTKEEVPDMIDRMVKEDKPYFISLRR